MGHLHLRSALLATVAALCVAAPAASAAGADQTYPIDGPVVAAARAIAASYWGPEPCAGDITVAWGSLPGSVNALSSWWNPTEAYGNAPENRHCVVTLNSDASFDWPMLCTVMVHEYGHLSGQQHSPDPANVMYYQYLQPIPQCSEASDPAPPAAAPQTSDLSPDPASLDQAQAQTRTVAAAKPRRGVRSAARQSSVSAPRHARRRARHRSGRRRH